MSEPKNETCQKIEWSNDNCGKPAKVEYKGKFYCGIHNPERRVKKVIERNEKLAREKKLRELNSELNKWENAIEIVAYKRESFAIHTTEWAEHNAVYVELLSSKKYLELKTEIEKLSKE